MLENHLIRCGKSMWNACWKSSGVLGFQTINASSFLRSLTYVSHPRGCQQQSNSISISDVTKVPFDRIHTHKSSSTRLFFGPSFMTKSSFSPLYVPVRNYQSVLRPRLHCKGCYFVWRHGRKFVECSDVPSHKQMKKVATRKVWLEDYSRGNVDVAMKWNRDLKRIAHRHVDKTVISHNWLASRIGKDI